MLPELLLRLLGVALVLAGGGGGGGGGGLLTGLGHHLEEEDEEVSGSRRTEKRCVYPMDGRLWIPTLRACYGACGALTLQHLTVFVAGHKTTVDLYRKCASDINLI